MRSGLNIRGLNTAATIWCSSALGILSGFGYFKFAGLGAMCVLGVNTLLRPVVALINRQPVDLSEQEFRYALQLTCMGRQEAQLRILLVQLTSVSPLVLHELESVVGRTQTHVVLKAILSSPERMDAQVEQLVSRLSLEKNVVGKLPGNCCHKRKQIETRVVVILWGYAGLCGAMVVVAPGSLLSLPAEGGFEGDNNSIKIS